MDKNFIENCKLLKKQFTKLETLTQTDGTAQSVCRKSQNTDDIIAEAKKLLLIEKLDVFCDDEIKDLKQSTLNYAKSLEKYQTNSKINHKICQQKQIPWNDDIFSDVIPFLNQKKNLEFINAQINNEDHQEIDFINNLEFLCKSVTKNDNEKKCSTENDNKIVEEKCVQTLESNDFNTKTENNEEIIITDKPIPELKIIPQHQKIIDTCLQVKKIDLEETENINFDHPTPDNEINNKNILIKSVVQWKSFTKSKKEINTKTNQSKINKFLENVKKHQQNILIKSKSNECISSPKLKIETKPKSSTCLENKITSFQHRFKAQKSIIEQQKEKLAEQSKLIEELTLNNITKEARKSLEKAKNDLNRIAKQSNNYKYKTKVKTKTKTNQENVETNLTLNFTKAPKVVQRMEKRAKEREEKRLLIKERKRLIDEEKKRQAEETIQRKIKEEFEEKQKQKEKMRQQREKVRQLEIRKQIEKKKYIEMNEMAFTHYKKKLIQNGFKFLKMLIFKVKINMEIAKRFYENNIIIKYFRLWKDTSMETIEYKKKLAINLYNSNIKQIAFNNWKSLHSINIQNLQVAIDRYNLSLQSNFLNAWHKLTCQYRMEYKINIAKAKKHYIRLLLYQCLHAWRSLPAIMEIERVQNERKRKWRLRVAEILSDYDPLKNYDF